MKNPIRESFDAIGGKGCTEICYDKYIVDRWLDSFDGATVTYPEPEILPDPDGNKAEVVSLGDTCWVKSYDLAHKKAWSGPLRKTRRDAIEVWNNVMRRFWK